MYIANVEQQRKLNTQGGIIVQKIRPQPGNVVRVQHDFSTSVDLVTTGFGARLLWFVGCQSDGEALSKYTSS